MDIRQYARSDDIASRVYKAWEAREERKAGRGHLGASEIGHECSRYLWLSFRKCFRKEFEGRILRLFDRGRREEAVIFEELKDAGITVSDTQRSFVAPFGHFGGSWDGKAIGVPCAEKSEHVLECKTHSAKSFAKLEKEGVAKAHPKHYDQMQVYMFFSGLKRALYYAVNKDSDEIYTERVREDKARQQALMAKAEKIVFAVEPPGRIAHTPADYRCKMCDAFDVCWFYKRPERHCRNCCSATPLRMTDPKETCPWKCDAGNPFGTPCGDHLFVPPIVADNYEMRDDGCVWYVIDGKRVVDAPLSKFPQVDDGESVTLLGRHGSPDEEYKEEIF